MSMNETQLARLVKIGYVAGLLQILLGIALFVLSLCLYRTLVPNVKEALAASVKIANNIPAITHDIATLLESADPAVQAVELKMDNISSNFISIGDSIQKWSTFKYLPNAEWGLSLGVEISAYGALIKKSQAQVVTVRNIAHNDIIPALNTTTEQSRIIVESLKSIPAVLDYVAWTSVAVSLVVIVNGLAMIILSWSRTKGGI